jgi:hypothetical protein
MIYKLTLTLLNSYQNLSDLDLVLFYLIMTIVLMALISIYAVIASTQKQKQVHQAQINSLNKQVQQYQIKLNKYRLSTTEFDNKQNVILEKIELIKYHSLGLRLILKSKQQP